MAGSSMAFSYDHGERAQGPNGLRKVTITWVSDASDGHATGTMEKVSGRLVKGVTIPSGGGTAPTTLYDINITDENSVDVLAGCKTGLGNRSATVTEETYFFVLNQDGTALSTSTQPRTCEKLTVAVTNAGNSKAGTIVLYYE